MRRTETKTPPTNQPRHDGRGFWQRLRERRARQAAQAAQGARAEPADNAPQRSADEEPLVLWPRVVHALAAAVTLGLLVAVALSYDVWSERTLQFKVRSFVVDGAERSGDAAIITATGLRDGSSLMGVDERTIAARVRALPWVRDVQVQVHMPGTLVLGVREHEPAALVVDGGLWVVDADGAVIKRKASDERVDVPLISGVGVADLRVDVATAADAGDARARKARAQSRIRELLALHARVEASALGARFRVGELNWDPVVGVSLVRRDDGAELRLGHRDAADLDHTLEQAQRLLVTLEQRGEHLRYALLDDALHPDRAVVATAARRVVAAGGPAKAKTPGERPPIESKRTPASRNGGN